MHPELAEDVHYVTAHGAAADVEALGYLLVAQAVSLACFGDRGKRNSAQHLASFAFNKDRTESGHP